ncbi:hypothetical protein [Szabonella alba]|uniref:Argininosuccinate lyase n=1 Tax=Szabonella alba TaxID=2804194 RepID=A0A8K0Y2L5_9RHOB|nr:hypothetical protein [Szabonella alba]MBL4918124.1 hypothetical protein [Szabonella alba]
MKHRPIFAALTALVLLAACGVDGAPTAPGANLSVDGDARFGITTK